MICDILKFFQCCLWVDKLASSRQLSVCAFLKLLARQEGGGPLVVKHEHEQFDWKQNLVCFVLSIFILAHLCRLCFVFLFCNSDCSLYVVCRALCFVFFLYFLFMNFLFLCFFSCDSCCNITCSKYRYYYYY